MLFMLDFRIMNYELEKLAHHFLKLITEQKKMATQPSSHLFL